MSIKKELPSIEIINTLLTYVPSTGQLFWKHRDDRWFSTLNHMDNWNTRYAGTEAGYISKRDSYVYIAICGVTYLAHRIIWAIIHGSEPDEIDHQNGNRSDNRLENLQSVSHAINCRNLSIASNNTSGCTGVYRNTRIGMWCAQIKIKGVTTHLGSFLHFNDAVQARKNAEVKLNFHKNHGKT